jgi:hypothetical protein
MNRGIIDRLVMAFISTMIAASIVGSANLLLQMFC